MTVIALVIFAVSHFFLIILFEKQRKKIGSLQQRNHQLYNLYRRYRRIAKQQNSELEMMSRGLTK